MQTRNSSDLICAPELAAPGKKAAHRQVLFHRHPREDTTPFRDTAMASRMIRPPSVRSLSNTPVRQARGLPHNVPSGRFFLALFAPMRVNLALIDGVNSPAKRLIFAVGARSNKGQHIFHLMLHLIGHGHIRYYDLPGVLFASELRLFT